MGDGFFYIAIGGAILILLFGGIRIMRRYPRIQKVQEQRAFTQTDEAWPGQKVERERIQKQEVCSDKSHWHS